MMTINSMADLDRNLGLPQPRITKEQIKATLKATMAVAETVREEGSCPAGPIYMALQARGATIEDYQAIIGTLERAGLISSTNETLTWTGPKLEDK